MKVIVAVILALGSASALGSGPYLPSGWKPQGPAFFLPNEVQKPADSPVKENILLETEASGSEGLREYGPPKVEESLNVVQALPDVVTEQTFYVVETEVAQGNVEQVAEIQQATTEETTESVDIRTQEVVEATTASYDVTQEALVEVAEVKEVEATLAAIEEKLENTVVQEEQKLEEVVVETVEGVNNIAEALINLDNEIKAEQKQSIEAAELKGTQESSGSAQAPEGFLEYGPPGFREYGPPKELLRSAVGQDSDSTNSFENNETRWRRFSPKFRASIHKRH